MLSEMQMCRILFEKFNHPMLKNLGRRFQKYMHKGHESLKDGGKGNLEERTTMKSKLDWMMGAVIGAKLTESVGNAVEPWLAE
jgi:dsRNA-specific ribonuclease